MSHLLEKTFKINRSNLCAKPVYLKKNRYFNAVNLCKFQREITFLKNDSTRKICIAKKGVHFNKLVRLYINKIVATIYKTLLPHMKIEWLFFYRFYIEQLISSPLIRPGNMFAFTRFKKKFITFFSVIIVISIITK